MKKFIALLLFFSLVGCAKKIPVYTTTEMYTMATAVDPNIEEVFIPAAQGYEHLRVICENYGRGCVPGTGKRFKVRGVEILVIQFATEETAREEAFRLNQWHARNWLFDDVTNEPVLEEFVKRAFNAVNPRQQN